MPRPATDLRQRILLAARQAFAARGVDATPLRAIAKAAGTTIGMIYYYYPTKDELYFAIVDEVYARVLEAFSALSPDPEEAPRSLRDRLLSLLRQLGALSVEDRQVVGIVLREITMSAVRRQWLLARFARGHIPLVVGAVARAQQSGELRSDLHPAVVVLATGALSALSTLLLEHAPIPGLPRGEARIADTLELLFSGIAGPKGRAGAASTSAEPAVTSAEPATTSAEPTVTSAEPATPGSRALGSAAPST